MMLHLLMICMAGLLPSEKAAEEKGLAIARMVEAADTGWGDEQLSAVMILKAGKGREVKRQIRVRLLEVDGDGDRSLTIFDRPGDVKGTVFLTHSHKMGDDDQWLYLPALRRVKRISSSNRSGPFMGSEFAYEDVASEELERYTYRFLRETDLGDGQSGFVFERFPVDANSGYSKHVVYVDKAHLRIHKIEYYDRKMEHQKTLRRLDYNKYGEFWRASTWEMVNHLRDKSTTLIWQDRAFKTGLTMADFDKNAIKRFK